MLTPSSNTVVEPETAKLLPQDGSVICHVSRLRVVTVSAEDASRGQFDTRAMVDAAALLADARVDLILWNGTAASWLGFAYDRTVTRAIAAATNIPATTAVIGINEALSRLGATRIGLVTPYVASMEADIICNYRDIGIAVVSAERLDITDNFAIGAVSHATIARMVRAVAAARPDAIVVMCTNLAGASIAASLSAELGIPVIDSVHAAVTHALERLAALDHVLAV
jgi:maleate isomerase